MSTSVKLFWLQNGGRMNWNGKVLGRESNKEAAALIGRERVSLRTRVVAVEMERGRKIKRCKSRTI